MLMLVATNPINKLSKQYLIQLSKEAKRGKIKENY
jgi:hypothetical protein